MSILDRDLWPVFLNDCQEVGLSAGRMYELADASVRYHRNPKSERDLTAGELELKWYRELALGRVAWEVYADERYVADLWACWTVYSRRYLKALSKTPIPSALRLVRSVADLGCGLGYTTGVLADHFGSAYGTNFPGISQTKIAERAGARYDFEVLSAPERPADLIFASEYFEHQPRPIEHLRDVLASVDPFALVVANAFSARSTGHFDEYDVDGEKLDGRATSREFGRVLKVHGFRRVETKLWNNRPAVYVKP